MLNRSYRIIWNAVQQTWQVASELAKGKVKSHQSINQSKHLNRL
ncbi:ESPR domain-containing protein [Pasteurellaceae bacterium 22721_9_1]